MLFPHHADGDHTVGPPQVHQPYSLQANLPTFRTRGTAVDRNRYFLIGVLLILLGLQFRLVDSFVLNEPTTRALARISRNSPVSAPSNSSAFLMALYPNPTKRVTPPRWIGLALVAVGTVISLHAFAVPKQ